MVEIKRDGAKLEILINPGMSDGRVLQCYWECSDNWYAELLAKRIRELLFQKLKAIRMDAYNAGWKDKASHKKPKETWFTGVWLGDV